MCGIAGMQVNPNDRALMARGRRRKLLANLLVGIESRGRDAAGVAWRTPDGRVWIQKDAVRASILADCMDTSGEWRTVLAHARWATQGSPKNNGNNHPIQVDSYIGVHNGHCSNDHELFAMLSDHDVERQAEVDTEAIFALMRYGARAFPEYDGNRSDLLALIEGTAALGWMLRDDPSDTLYLARAAGSPLFIGHTPGRSLIFASTRAILVNACDRANVELAKITEIREGTALKVRGGRVRTVTRFFAAVQPRRARYKGSAKRSAEAFVQRARAIEAPAKDRKQTRLAAANSTFDHLAPEPRTAAGWPAWDGDDVVGWDDDELFAPNSWDTAMWDHHEWTQANESYLSATEQVLLDRRLLLDE